jgi:hypothetical protein
LESKPVRELATPAKRLVLNGIWIVSIALRKNGR